VPHEENDRGTNATKNPTNIATMTEAPTRTEEGGELDVAHAESSWVDEDDQEEHEPAPSAARDPLDRRMSIVRERENDDRAGQDDLVRNQPMLEVGARDHNEYPAEDQRDERLERESEGQTTAAPGAPCPR
jgi:hypothetical protein